MHHKALNERPRSGRAGRALLSLALFAAAASCEGEVQRFDMLFDPCRPLVLEPEDGEIVFRNFELSVKKSRGAERVNPLL